MDKTALDRCEEIVNEALNFFGAKLRKSLNQPTYTYRTRFQIEFYFRNSKQITGLNGCQARDLHKLDFAFNASLASVNIVKVMWMRHYPDLSIGLLKACLSSIYIIRRILDKSSNRPNRTLNAKLVKELF